MTSKTDPTQESTAGPDLPGLLVDPTWLEERLGDADVRPVDLRDRDAHLSGHIPGAVHLDLAELGSSVGGRDNVLIPPDEFSDLMARRGISNGDRVVAYDDQWSLAAARLAWACHHYGHTRIAVLNGGWDRWRDEARVVASGRESVAPGRFEVEVRTEVRADRDWVLDRVRAGDAVLVDSRTPAEFDAGHLPGAINWDWFNAVPSGSWAATRDPEELRAEWRALGVDPSDEVTVYCRSGMRAAHTWWALRNAGYPRVRLYDGSWQEWSMAMESTKGGGGADGDGDDGDEGSDGSEDGS